MAHQAHNIPWNTLASHLKFVQDAKQFTPPLTDLTPCGHSRQAKDLEYFMGRFSATIKDFSATERAKYAEPFVLKTGEKLFTDDLLASNLKWTSLSAFGPVRSNSEMKDLIEAQDVDSWIRRVPRAGYAEHDHPYNEAVALLLAENQMETLLTLANHPEIGLTTLDLGNNYQYSYFELVRVALAAYICFNVLMCKSELITTRFTDIQRARSYQSVINQLMTKFGGEFVHLTHRRFVGIPWPVKAAASPHEISQFNPFCDLVRLKSYLKECFDLFVRLDIIHRECKQDIDWKAEIRRAFGKFGFGVFGFSFE